MTFFEYLFNSTKITIVLVSFIHIFQYIMIDKKGVIYMKFIETGIRLQQEAMTKEMANKAFEYSCKCCCNRGLNISCEKWQIKMVHDITISIFDDFSHKENPLS